jgi:hypothetical protein
MYNTPYVKRLDLLKIKKDKEDLEKMKNKEKLYRSMLKPMVYYYQIFTEK